MKATINDLIYDTDEAEYQCSDSSPDGDDTLYRAEDGRFFLEVQETFLDGVKLRPGESVENLAPELDVCNNDLGESPARISRRRRKRERVLRRIVPMTEREALTWCVKTQMPDCFRGYVLESI